MQETDEVSVEYEREEQPWQLDNRRAISLGTAGRWADAVDAFDEALQHAPRFVESPETHAVLRSNLAQALFRIGDTSSAIENARRSLAARVVCCDSEQEAPMARARADLAVYLAASGALDEARAMLDAATTAMEALFGDEDIRLISLLENQARLALLADQPANAEPPLLRLHALLESVGEDVSTLDGLFARVAAARRSGSTTPPEVPIFPSNTPSEVTVIDDDDFDLIDDHAHAPLRSPNAQSILSEGLIEPGTHSTPATIAHTNPLGFEIQYGVPAELLAESQSPITLPDVTQSDRPSPPPLDNPFW